MILLAPRWSSPGGRTCGSRGGRGARLGGVAITISAFRDVVFEGFSLSNSTSSNTTSLNSETIARLPTIQYSVQSASTALWARTALLPDLLCYSQSPY